jgi:hypothetical protein
MAFETMRSLSELGRLSTIESLKTSPQEKIG